MANPSNVVIVRGNLADDVRVYNNENGSRAIVGTLMVDNNYRSQDGTVKSNGIPFRHTLSARFDGIGGWAHTGKGDSIELMGELEAPSWIDKETGETVYGGLGFKVTEFPGFLESRATTQARRQAQGQNQQNNAAPVAQQPAAPQAPAYGQNPVQQNQNPAQYNAPVAPVAPQMPQQNAPMYGGQPVQNNQPQAPQAPMQQPQQNAPIGSNVAPVAPGQYNTGPSAF